MEILNSAAGWVLIVLSQFLAIDGVHVGLMMLVVVFLVDYATGLGASWAERHTRESSSPFFLQSKKMRDSLLKACTYLLFIFMSWVMWYLFFDGTVTLPISTKPINIISITIGVCIAVEMWSILENMKRMGFDLLGKIVRTFKTFWKTYNEVTHE